MYAVYLYSFALQLFQSHDLKSSFTVVGGRNDCNVDTIGVTPARCRPPYGDIDDIFRAIAFAMGMQTLFWIRNRNTISQIPISSPKGDTLFLTRQPWNNLTSMTDASLHAKLTALTPPTIPEHSRQRINVQHWIYRNGEWSVSRKG